jgi:biopolymer transport protein ExbB
MSIVSLAAIGERFWFFRSYARRRTHALIDRALAYLANGRVATAAGMLESVGQGAHPRVAAIRAGILPRGLSVERMRSASLRECAQFRHGLSLLRSVCAVAPVLGILGTVWGIMDTFAILAPEGQAPTPEALTGGVAKALLTTAAGLVVAIPALLALARFEHQCQFELERFEADLATVEGAARVMRAKKAGKEVS